MPVPVPTLGEYADAWLARHRPHLEPRTIDTYRYVFERHFTFGLADTTLDTITRGLIDSWLETLGRHGFAASTIRLAVSVLSFVLNAAVVADLIPRNPALGISTTYRKQPKPVAGRVYDDRQLRLFLTTTAEVAPMLLPAYALYGRGGLRVGEGRGAKPGDVDLDARTLAVTRQVHRTGREAHPKFRSFRTIDLSAQLVSILAPLIAGRRRWLLSATGAPIRYREVRVGMRTVALAAGLHTIPPKNLRHSCASILLAKGTSLEYVSRMLGHADPRITAVIYGRWLRHERPDVMDLT